MFIVKLINKLIPEYICDPGSFVNKWYFIRHFLHSCNSKFVIRTAIVLNSTEQCELFE